MLQDSVSSEENLKEAVLITTGAMNPVHRGHVSMLHQAKDRLYEAGYKVVAAYLSPSNDLYVQPKCKNLKTIGFSDKFRMEIVNRAVEEDSLVKGHSYEINVQGRWPDYPEVCKEV